MGQRVPSRSSPFFGPHVPLDFQRHLVVGTPDRPDLFATWLCRFEPGFGWSAPSRTHDALVVCVSQKAVRGGNATCNGRPRRWGAREPGSTTLLDGRQIWTVELLDPFESIHLYFDRSSLAALAEERRLPSLEALGSQADPSRIDPVLRHLSRALVPAFMRPREASLLYLESLQTTIWTHLAQIHGSLPDRPKPRRGGLSTRQLREAMERMRADLTTDVSLAELAAQCGLSVRHFARAYKETTGLSPHRWRLKMRVTHGQGLLSKTDDTLKDIALACGFADQSHFTRVFRAFAGMTPGAWRRRHRTAARREAETLSTAVAR